MSVLIDKPVAVPWLSGMTFRCDCCWKERPFEQISVRKHPHIIGGLPNVQCQVNYCNDNAMCVMRSFQRCFFPSPEEGGRD